MFARILRQYRRFLFGSLLLTLACTLALVLGAADIPSDLEVGPILGLSWVILLVLVIGSPVIVLALLLPGLLPLVELWLMTLILMVLLDPFVGPAMQALGLPGWSYCLIPLAGFILVERTLYGPWLMRFWRRDMAPNSATLTLPGTPEALWPRLCPTPGQITAFYWPGATILPTPEGTEADFVLSLPRRAAAKDDLFAVTMTETAHPTQLRYKAIPMAGTPTPSIVIDIRITPLDEEQCRLTYTQTMLDVPFGQRLFYYLGHNFRDTLASLRARLTGRQDWSLQGAQMLRG